MIRRFLPDFLRRAGGRPSALLLVCLLLSVPALAQEDPPVDAASLAGTTLRELAAQPGAAPIVRSVVRGRQEIIFRHLRAPGEPVRAEDGYAWGWGCNGGDCGRDGLFLAYEPRTGNLWMLLVRDGELDRQVPPRGSPWPEPLVRAVTAQRGDLGARMSRGR